MRDTAKVSIESKSHGRHFHTKMTGLVFSLAFAVAFATVLIAPAKVIAHGGGNLRVEMEPNEKSTYAAGKVSYTFELVDNTKKQAVTAAELTISHEKLLHLVVYDSGLKEFQHVHPEFLAGKWSAELQFARNGTYWIWAQGKLAGDGVEFSAPTEITITAGTAANPVPAVLKPTLGGDDGVSVVTLTAPTLRAGKMVMIDAEFSRTDGSSPVLTDYLGAPAHVIAVSGDADSLLHVHPMAGATPEKMMIHATFPAAGMYRLWMQFIDGGVLKTIPLAVKVLK